MISLSNAALVDKGVFVQEEFYNKSDKGYYSTNKSEPERVIYNKE
jgi:hypothetical protein